MKISQMIESLQFFTSECCESTIEIYYFIKRTTRRTWYNLRCRVQRFKRGYAYGDVWDMDDWFVHTIKPMLIHLRDYGDGTPSRLFSEDECKGRDYWENILTEMITCLDMMDETNVRKCVRSCKSKDYTPMIEDDYNQIIEIMVNNKNRFFELFSEYFYNLWD